ncbi:MAG: hypothetical protein GC147_08205 [Porphyrobacter sp.]|nr:hypothetical protein [Porphyrobacter sp.]
MGGRARIRLQRIAEDLKAQNWLAVFLDFLIVVSGVFIGIQVANWNEGRLERGRERAALAALLAETQDNLSYIDLIIERTRPSREDREAALAMLRGETPARGNPERGLLAMTEFRDLTPISGTYDELTAAGDIALIRSKPLRRELALVQGVNRFNDRRREEFIAAAPDILALADPYLTIVRDTSADGGRRAQVDWARARRDRALVNAVNRAMADQAAWFDRYGMLLRQTASACLALADAAGSRCRPEDWVAAEAAGREIDTNSVRPQRVDAFLNDLRAK